MSKEFGHTKTLFIQSGKYKWSYKHEHCIKCGTCNFKHKGNGFCTSCHDKNRFKKLKRRIITRKSSDTYYQSSKTDINKHNVIRRNIKNYQQKNREVLSLIAKAIYNKKHGKPYMEIMINGKTRLLPFETLEKPALTTDLRYDLWRRNIKEYELLINYYNKNEKRKTLQSMQ